MNAAETSSWGHRPASGERSSPFGDRDSITEDLREAVSGEEGALYLQKASDRPSPCPPPPGVAHGAAPPVDPVGPSRKRGEDGERRERRERMKRMRRGARELDNGEDAQRGDRGEKCGESSCAEGTHRVGAGRVVSSLHGGRGSWSLQTGLTTCRSPSRRRRPGRRPAGRPGRWTPRTPLGASRSLGESQPVSKPWASGSASVPDTDPDLTLTLSLSLSLTPSLI